MAQPRQQGRWQQAHAALLRVGKHQALLAPGNGAAIGGIKVCTENGWFAARPSGTEALYKIYAESFISEAHLQLLIDEAQGLLAGVL